MFERDYLVRMLVDLAAAISRSLNRARQQKDLQSAVDVLETSIGKATDLDGSVLLTLSPDSIAQVMQVSNTDPRVVLYVANSMELQAHYLKQLNNNKMSELRHRQAIALANAYNIELSDQINDVDDEMFDEKAFIDSLNEMCDT